MEVMHNHGAHSESNFWSQVNTVGQRYPTSDPTIAHEIKTPSGSGKNKASRSFTVSRR